MVPDIPRERAPVSRGSTGPDAKTREAVYERDRWRCVCCGTPVKGRPHSIGHRKRRSQGGRHEMPNLVTFLGWGNGLTGAEDHHYRIDQRRNPADEDRGLTVRSYKNPADVPVRLWDGRLVFLTTDGGLSDSPASPRKDT